MGLRQIETLTVAEELLLLQVALVYLVSAIQARFITTSPCPGAASGASLYLMHKRFDTALEKRNLGLKLILPGACQASIINCLKRQQVLVQLCVSGYG